jgi:hypothetical protein
MRLVSFYNSDGFRHNHTVTRLCNEEEMDLEQIVFTDAPSP